MPKLVTPLTEAKVKNAKSKDKPYKLADGGGLYLEVMPTGSKLWRMKFIQANGKENRLAFGSYPEVTIANARAAREKARTLQKEGTDPAQARRIEQHKRAIASANTFEAVAREWHGNKSETWSKDTADNAIHRLEKDIFPLVGKTPISEVDAPMMLDALRQVERRGAVEIASRLAQHCGQIFRFAVASGIIKYNPLPDLREALKKRAKGHHAAIGVAELPDFLRALQKNEADMHYATRILMRIMMLVFVRTSELIETPWSEVDLENEIWIIPWQRMKMGRKTLNPDMVDHHVNMPRQGWELLRDLHELTGAGKYVFPKRGDPSDHVSNGAILAALRRMGYSGKMTGHGFRALAMGVIKAELGYRHETVDRQLAHKSKDANGEAYDRERFIAERKEMMQSYADYLDAIERGEKVMRALFRHTHS
jgi:integrase